LKPNQDRAPLISAPGSRFPRATPQLISKVLFKTLEMDFRLLLFPQESTARDSNQLMKYCAGNCYEDSISPDPLETVYRKCENNQTKHPGYV
jgi:hypothetical protein